MENKEIVSFKSRRLGVGAVYKKHLESVERREQKKKDDKLQEDIANAYNVVKTLETVRSQAPGAMISPAVYHLSPMLGPSIETMLNDNLSRIKQGK